MACQCCNSTEQQRRTRPAQTSEFEQDQHRWSTRIPPLLCRKAVVIAGAPVSAAPDETQTSDSRPQSAVIRPTFYTDVSGNPGRCQWIVRLGCQRPSMTPLLAVSPPTTGDPVACELSPRASRAPSVGRAGGAV